MPRKKTKSWTSSEIRKVKVVLAKVRQNGTKAKHTIPVRLHELVDLLAPQRAPRPAPSRKKQTLFEWPFGERAGLGDYDG